MSTAIGPEKNSKGLKQSEGVGHKTNHQALSAWAMPRALSPRSGEVKLPGGVSRTLEVAIHDNGLGLSVTIKVVHGGGLDVNEIAEKILQEKGASTATVVENNHIRALDCESATKELESQRDTAERSI